MAKTLELGAKYPKAHGTRNGFKDPLGVREIDRQRSTFQDDALSVHQVRRIQGSNERKQPVGHTKSV